MPDDFREYLRAKQALVDSQLPRLLDLAADAPSALIEAIQYSLLAPGKRLRPCLTILAAEACGGTAAVALPAGCAVEMVHTYSLIHDDLPAMDDDDLRRGLPTCHKKFGEALAILAGDALLTLAFQVLSEYYPAITASACCRELARGAGAVGMVGGQVLDLAWESRAESRESRAVRAGGVSPLSTPTSERSAQLQDLENIHARKTGALFRASLRMGVWTAQGERPGGPDPKLLDSLDAYGRCFGQVFQITDDLLDVESTADQTGKRTGKDAEKGKLTYPGFMGVSESRKRVDELAREGMEHLKVLGIGGEMLAGLMEMVVKRDR